MAKIRITTVPGLNGDYELATPPFTRREWREIKINTGLRPLEFEEAHEKGDPDVVAAILWVTLTRAGVNGRMVWQELDDTDVFMVAEDVEETEPELEEGDAGPPDRIETGDVLELDNVSTLNSSGRTTTPSTEISPSPLSAIGTQL